MNPITAPTKNGAPSITLMNPAIELSMSKKLKQNKANATIIRFLLGLLDFDCHSIQRLLQDILDISRHEWYSSFGILGVLGNKGIALTFQLPDLIECQTHLNPTRFGLKVDVV